MRYSASPYVNCTEGRCMCTTYHQRHPAVASAQEVRLTHLEWVQHHLGGAEAPARALGVRVPRSRSQQPRRRASSRAEASAHRKGGKPPAGICSDPLRLGETQIRRELELLATRRSQLTAADNPALSPSVLSTGTWAAGAGLGACCLLYIRLPYRPHCGPQQG